ncbi:MAG TPA: alanine--tRNA ligase-related protein [Candidatus Saccharimonadales bacterium]
MTAQEIRQKYLEFFKKQGHALIPRANLLPLGDPTTLFTGSGMQPLIQYLLGEKHPNGQRLVDSQTCLRAEDIDEVGDNRHTTFFEMLGNWSLGDYFKDEQLGWFLGFLTEEVGLSSDKLYVTCFIGDESLKLPRDETSAAIWQKLFKRHRLKAETADIGSAADGYKRGIKPNERIFYYDASKNWWSRAGLPNEMPIGEPGGPDSEVFYDFGTDHDPKYGAQCHPNCDCGRFLEIGNSVFMEYVRTKDGFKSLPNKNVDFGGGLERIAAASNNNPDVFKISLMWPVIEKLAEMSGKKYEDHIESKRIITDHLRAAVWLAVDGLVPSNKEQGYVMRRLIRRAVLNAHELGIEHGLSEAVVPVVVNTYKADFPEVAERAEMAVQTIAKEEKIFRQTLKKGLREFEKLAITISVNNKEVKDTKLTDAFYPYMKGADIFMLYDTYGFPVELSLEEAKKRGIEVDSNWRHDFNHLMEEQRARSRTATKGQFKGGLGGQSDAHKRLHTATHLLYATLKTVLGDHVIQRGANITKERLRFDFEHPGKLTDKEKVKVEKLINQQIDKCLPVGYTEYPTSEAISKGALGQFGDKYGDKVKVYTVGEGDQRYSFEICGGPHVDNTCELKETGRFKIIKEESSSSGIRRIKAVLK